MTLRLHAVEFASRANGPGLRAVVWFQGCTLGCPGCFNPGTQDPAGGFAGDTPPLARELLARRAGNEGVSFSGGEPFLQAAALLDLVRRLAGSGLSLLAFSGYTLEEIRTLEQGAEILAHLDVLIAGRYLRARPLGRGLLGSSNQQLHLLSPRHTRADFADIPVSEVILHADGSVTLSGLARPLLGPS